MAGTWCVLAWLRCVTLSFLVAVLCASKASAAGQPDLIVQNVSFSPASGLAGTNTTVSYRIRNQGTAAAGASHSRICLSADSSVTWVATGCGGGDVQLGADVPASGIAAGSYLDFNQSVTIPSGQAAGSYYIGVMADAINGELVQSNENNDSTVSSSQFTVTPPAKPIISSILPNPVVGSNSQQQIVITGTNFQPGAIIQWNTGTTRTPDNTTATQIVVSPQFGNDQSNWTATVVNPGGTPSDPFPFSVISPLPVIKSMSPLSAVAGSAAFTLTLLGDTFTSDAKVQWKGSNRGTRAILAGKFVTGLQADILSSDVATSGQALITVVNSGAGGPSAPWTFTIAPNNVNMPTVSITALPSQMVSKQLYSASWTISGGANISHSNIHWDIANPETGPQPDCLPGSSSCSTLIKTDGARTQTDSFTAPPPGTYLFVAHAIVDGANIYSPRQTVQVASSITLPNITISNPANNAILTGITTITGNAYDAKSVVGVAVQVDNGAFVAATLVNPQWNFAFNPAGLAPGVHKITAKATNSDGQFATAAIQINIPTPQPSGCSSLDVGNSSSLAQPLDSKLREIDDQCITSTTDEDWYQIYATVGSPMQFDLTVPPGKDYDLELYGPPAIGNTLQPFIKASRSGVGLPETISHTAQATGYYALRVFGFNGSMDLTNPYILKYTPKPSNTPPTATITNPTGSVPIQGITSVTGTAQDADGVSTVEVLVDGVSRGTAVLTGTAWTYSLDTTSPLLPNGPHQIAARAIDIYGNDYTTDPRVVTVNNVVSLCGKRIAGTSAANAYALSPSATISNQCLISGQDTHWYKITANAGVKVTLNLTPPSNRNFDLAFYNSSNNLLQTASSGGNGQPESFSYTVPVNGDYFVQVKGNSVSDFDTLYPYAIGYTLPATTPDLTVALGNLQPGYQSGQVNVPVRITVSRSGAMLTNGSSAQVWLYWSAVNQWNSQLVSFATYKFPNTELNNSNSSFLDATINIPVALQNQTFYLIAYVDPPSSDYPNGFHGEADRSNNFAVKRVDVAALISCAANLGNNSKSNAFALNPGVPVEGAICNATDEKWFKINLPIVASGKINVTLSKRDKEYHVQIYDSGNNALLTGNWRKAAGVPEEVTCPYTISVGDYGCQSKNPLSSLDKLPAGDYYVKVYSAGGSNFGAPYNLKWEMAGADMTDIFVSASAQVLDFAGKTMPNQGFIWPGVKLSMSGQVVSGQSIGDMAHVAPLQVEAEIYNSQSLQTPVMSDSKSAGYSLNGDHFVAEFNTLLPDGAYQARYRVSALNHDVVPWTNLSPFTVYSSQNVKDMSGLCSTGASSAVGNNRIFLCAANADKNALDYTDETGAAIKRTPLILINGICFGGACKSAATNLPDDYEHVWDNFLGQFSVGGKFASLMKGYKPYIFRYETGMWKSPLDANSVPTIAAKLRENLENVQLAIPKDRQIVIVAHSLGGLVARSFMQDKDCDDGSGNATVKCWHRTFHLLTFATPHRGISWPDVVMKKAIAPFWDPALLADSIEENTLPDSNTYFDALLSSTYLGKQNRSVSSDILSRISAYYTTGAPFGIDLPEPSTDFYGFDVHRYGPFLCLWTLVAHSALPRGNCGVGVHQNPMVFDYVQKELDSYLPKAPTLILEGRNTATADSAAPFMPQQTHVRDAQAGLTANVRWVWNSISSATAYKVVDLEGLTLKSLSGDATTWTETGLAINKIYARKVLAYNASGLWLESLPVSRATAAAPPVSATATATKITGARVVWENASNPSDTSYQVQASSTPGFDAKIMVDIVSGQTSADIGGLLPGVTYYFRVQAINRDGVPSDTSQNSTVTLPSPPPSLTIVALSGAGRTFAADSMTSVYLDSIPVAGGTMFISTEPGRNPVEVSTGDIATARNLLPNSYPDSSDTTREFVLYVGTGSYTGSLTGSITIPYADADNDGIVDGTSPPLAASALVPYTLQGGKWVLVQGPYSRDFVNHTVTFPIEHLSVYTINGPQAAAPPPTQSAIRAYPVPWKPGAGGKFDSANVGGCGQGLVFDGLTGEATIRIYNLVGDLVRELSVVSSDNGCKAWDGRNNSGRDVASGIYIAVIKGTGSKTVKKLAIER